MRRPLLEFVSLCAAALFLLAAVPDSFACSCVASPTVDKAFAESANVAILKVAAIEKYPEGEPALDGGAIKQARLVVTKVFKGDLKTGEELTFTQGICCICMWMFEESDVGDEVLFYLGKRREDGIWSASICSRSRRLPNVAADLLYLENEKKRRGQTRLSGELTKIVKNIDESVPDLYTSLPNRKIRVSGNGKSVELTTDANGVYEIYGLPAGKYRVTPEKLVGFRHSSFAAAYSEVVISPKGHTETDFYFEIDNSISGRVVDPAGKPFENVCLDLVPAKTASPQRYLNGRCTDENGRFEINSIAPGAYRLVINKDDEPRLYEPFQRFYYPVATRPEDAAVFNIDANFFLRDLVIVPPSIIETLEIAGRLTYADGAPVDGVTIRYLRGEQTSPGFAGFLGSDFEKKTDRDGRFSFRVLKGNAGVLRATFYTFRGEYENCPEIETLIGANEGVQRVDTADFMVDAIGSNTSIEIGFPFKSCREKK